MVGSHSSGPAAQHKLVSIGDAYNEARAASSEPDEKLQTQQARVRQQLAVVDEKLRAVNVNSAKVEENIYQILQEALFQLQDETQRKMNVLLGEELELRRQLEQIGWAESFLDRQRSQAKPVNFLTMWKAHLDCRAHLAKQHMPHRELLEQVQPDMRLVGGIEVVTESTSAPQIGRAANPNAAANASAAAAAASTDFRRGLFEQRDGAAQHLAEQDPHAMGAAGNGGLIVAAVKRDMANHHTRGSPGSPGGSPGVGGPTARAQYGMQGGDWSAESQPYMQLRQPGGGLAGKDMNDVWAESLKKNLGAYEASHVAGGSPPQQEQQQSPAMAMGMGGGGGETKMAGVRHPVLGSPPPPPLPPVNAGPPPQAAAPVAPVAPAAPVTISLPPPPAVEAVAPSKEGADDEESDAEALDSLFEKLGNQYSLSKVGAKRRRRLGINSVHQLEQSTPGAFPESRLIPGGDEGDGVAFDFRHDLYCCIPLQQQTFLTCAQAYTFYEGDDLLDAEGRPINHVSEIQQILVPENCASVFVCRSGDRVFGGYAAEPWQLEGEFFGGAACFLFSVDSDLLIPYTGRKTEAFGSDALYDDEGVIQFGRGPDLALRGDLTQCSSHLESGYGLGLDDKMSKLVLAGQEHFKIDEIEVWALVMPQ